MVSFCGLFGGNPNYSNKDFFEPPKFEQRFFRMSLPIDKMFRVQTHQGLWTFICLALSRGGPQGQLARQISRCFWVLDHPFEFALPHLPCTLRFGLSHTGTGKTFRTGIIYLSVSLPPAINSQARDVRSDELYWVHPPYQKFKIRWSVNSDSGHHVKMVPICQVPILPCRTVGSLGRWWVLLSSWYTWVVEAVDYSWVE